MLCNLAIEAQVFIHLLVFDAILLCYVTQTWLKVSNMDMCLSVGICNNLKILHVFDLKISVGVSIPMSECRVSDTGTRDKMKNPSNIGRKI